MSFDSNNRNMTIEPTIKKTKRSKFKNIFLAGILLVSLPFGEKFAEANDSDGLSTIHHVYLNDEYIGLLSDEEKLNALKKAKIENAEKEFQDLSLAIQEGLSVIPERVFNAKTDDQVVLNQLEEQLAVETEGVGVQINDEVALHIKDQESYEEMIRAFKLQAVSKEELAAYEEMIASKEPLPELKENETRIAKIVFSEEIEPVTEKVHPEKVYTVSEALKILNKGTLDEKKYSIQSGDVLGKIAQEHGMATKELMALNNDLTEDSVLQIGDELNVTLLKPYIELEVHYESKNLKEIAFDKVTEKDKTMDKGNKKVRQEGKNGEKVVTEYIRKKNGQVIGSSVSKEQVLSEPVDEITVIGTKVTPSKGTGTFQWPTVGGYVSSGMGTRWGRMHKGIDIARPSNRSILASDNGVVVSTGYSGGYGNKIVIDHNNGYRTLYAHLSSISVKPGQVVSAGTTIGVMGSTGHSTGIHLHFEVTKNGSLVNPLNVLN